MAVWSQLPPELLGCVLERLPLLDHFSFGCVCTTWYSAAFSKLHRPARQAPWLMLPAGRREDPRDAHFFALPDGRTRTLRLLPNPPIRNRAWIGSSDGWLISADERSELHLVNPLTGDQIELPSVTTFPSVDPVREGPDGLLISYRLARPGGRPPDTLPAYGLRFIFYVKAIVWWTPPSTSTSSSSSATVATTSGGGGGGGGGHRGNYTVALIYNPFERLAFARTGDPAWRTVDLPHAEGFTDLIQHLGCLFTINCYGQTAVWTTADHPPTPAAYPPRMMTVHLRLDFNCFPNPEYSSQTKYLVESAATGALIQVWRAGKLVRRKPVMHRTVAFKVFRVDVDACMWVEVDDLGDEALFLGRGCSVSVMAAAAGVEGNRIYFTDDYYGSPEMFRREPRDMGVFCLEDGRFEHFYPEETPLRWPPPLWLTPSLL